METALSIIAIVISVISGVISFCTFHWTARRDRKQATLDAYNQLQEQALDQLNHYAPANIREIAKNRRSDEYKTISEYIARIEHFCVGVNSKIYDRKTVYELAEGYLDGSIKTRIEPIISVKNCSGQDYYENIHRVYAWMNAERERRKRKSIQTIKNEREKGK